MCECMQKIFHSSEFPVLCISYTAVNVKKFKPDPHVPALQYVGEVDRGGAADCAGLEEGDFIIEVSCLIIHTYR